MVDVVDSATRSRMMAGIQGKNTKPELLVRKYFHGRGLRYRLHAKELPGKPDLVFPKYKAVIFVHGCFWHQHIGCKYASKPQTRTEFWTHKFSENVKRDSYQIAALEGLGWRVFVVWECELLEGTSRLESLLLDISQKRI
jgi:DNA mismatch endonuclease (patch repair protein)